jgi:hypothetical protein
VASHHRDQMGVLVRDGLVSIVPAPVRNRRQRADIAVLCRYLPHHILPFSDLPQTWAKPRKVYEVPFVSGKKLTTEPRWQIRPSFGTQSEE